MNILIVTNLYPLPWEPNRASFNKQQFDRLSEKHHISILVPVAWPGYLKHRNTIRKLRSKNLRFVCYLYTPRILYGLFGRFMYWSIRLFSASWLDRQHFDLVFGSWAFPDGYAAARIAKRACKPYVIKVHGSDINLLEIGSRRARLTKEVCSNAASVVAVSDALRRKLCDLGVPSAKVTRIYNGVNHQLFYPVDRSSKAYFLFIGNLKREKGIYDLLDAYEIYRRSGGQRKLWYVGGGAELRTLSAAVNEKKLTNHVRLVGALSHESIPPILREAIALILPSYHEGVPNVLLEAASCGIPVLSTRVGGIPEVVDENKTGVLVAAGCIQEIVEGLFHLENSDAWDREKIIEHAYRFSWTENISRLNNLLINQRDFA